MTVLRRPDRFGTLQRDLPFLKDVIDYRLTRHPRIYLFVERFRTWVNWDKRVYLSFVRKGDFVLDVGANVGAHAIFLSHLVGEEGSVLAFEPLPSNVDALHETIERRSRIANIHIIQTAVGNPDGSTETVTMRSPADDLTQASLHAQSAGSWHGARALREFYRSQYSSTYMSERQAVEKAVNATANVYRRNVFPEMNVQFGTHPNNIGHMDFPGCFRCHDDNHKAKDGAKIGQDCDACHHIQ